MTTLMGSGELSSQPQLSSQESAQTANMQRSVSQQNMLLGQQSEVEAPAMFVPLHAAAPIIQPATAGLLHGGMTLPALNQVINRVCYLLSTSLAAQDKAAYKAPACT